MIHVVMGSTGEYSDRSEWPVRAFLDPIKAEAFERSLQQQADVLKSQHLDPDDNDFYSWRYELRVNGAPSPIPEDPGFDMDYTGTYYSTMHVPLDGDDNGHSVI